MKQAGIIYATDQIIDLYANGITNVHVYSMNKPDVAEGILKNVSAILGKNFAGEDVDLTSMFKRTMSGEEAAG